METGTFKSISKESNGVYKEKGSKFLAFAFPVENENDIATYREKIKKQYHDARHHVYAFRLGADMNIFRASDDGEPANSSGQPVLNKIRSFELTDILIIVVRYFGGTKLGIPGLIRAYGTAAEDAINNNQIIIKTLKRRLCILFDYSQINDVMKIINDYKVEVVHRVFESNCKIEIEINENIFEQVIQSIQNNHRLIVEYPTS
jgi:uncharacterized YigZ family protein